MGSIKRARALVNPNDNDGIERIDALGPERIAESIHQIAKAMDAIERTRLSRKAIVALIHDQSRLSKKDIELVLNNLKHLGQDWLKKNVQP